MRLLHVRTAGILLVICSCFLALPAFAQESASAAVDQYDWGGAIELGYRFTDIEGVNRFREAVNLEEGLRLFDLNLWVKDLERKGIADEFRFRLNSIGDPFPSGRLDMKKHDLYRLSLDYREYAFFSNRLDFQGPFDAGNTLLTDNHDFDQTRRMGRAVLSLFPSSDVRLNFGYNFASRTGNVGHPRAITFVPRFIQDLDEHYGEYFGSIDFPLGNWDFHVKQSFWTFDRENRIEQLPSLSERWDESVWTYVSTIRAHTQIGDCWDIDAAYVAAHSESDSRLGLTRSLPVQVRSGDGEVLFDTHILELGLSRLLRQDLILHFDYRFHTFDQDGDTTTDLFFLPRNLVQTQYSLFAHTGTTQLEYLPSDKLTLRGGYRLQYRQIEAENFQPNVFDGGPSSSSADIFSHTWVASVDWKPFKSLSLFGEYEGDASDNPYTRISPQDQHVAKLRVRYDTPLKGLILRGSTLWKRRTNPDQNYRLDVQDYVLAATYQPAALQRLILDVSYTYEKILDKKAVLNEAGIGNPLVPLFSTFTFDSDAQIFSGGISCESFYKGLGGSFTGTYARTFKENDQKFAFGSLKLWYRGYRLIPVVAFERYYLSDLESPADSFSANMVTLSLRKEW